MKARKQQYGEGWEAVWRQRVLPLAAGLFLAAAAAGAAEPWADAAGVDAMRERIRALIPPGPRLPGMPANLELEKRVAERFAASGFEHGDIGFAAPAFVPGDTRLTAGGRSFVLHPMHPGLFRPGNLAERAFTADLVDLRNGRVEDLDALRGVDLQGCLFLLDFNCGRGWESYLRFGPRGFVFAGADAYTFMEACAKVPNTEASVPRFFVTAADAAALRGAMRETRRLSVEVEAEPSIWERRELRDLWVAIPGADPALAGEVMVFVAPMDANSVVPGLAEGAEAGANLALLLDLLDEFQAIPPARTVVLAALNARTQNFLGDRMLAWYLLAPRADVERMRNNLATETRLHEMLLGHLGKVRMRPETSEADEAFLIRLRHLTDDTIGRQVTVKEPLVALSKRDVNEIKGRRLRLLQERSALEARAKTEVSEELRAAASARAEVIAAETSGLDRDLAAHVNVLTLFNRVGIQTRLSDLSEDERDILRGYLETACGRYQRWAELNRRDLERSGANGRLRQVLEGRRVSMVLCLDMTWKSRQIGFGSLLPAGRPPWADLWGRATARMGDELEDVREGRRANLLVDALSNVGGQGEWFYVPARNSGCLTYQKVQRTPALSLGSVFASTESFTPSDTFDRLDMGAVAEVAAFSRLLFRRLLADPGITGPDGIRPLRASPQDLWSVMIKAYKFDEFAAGVLPQIPVPGSMIVLTKLRQSLDVIGIGGVVADDMALTDERAMAAFIGLSDMKLSSAAFHFDPEFRKVDHALDAGETHRKTSSDITVADSRTLSLFECREFVVPARADASLTGAGPIGVAKYLPLSAERNSEPKRYGVSGASSVFSTKYMTEAHLGPAVFFLQASDRLKLLTDARRLALNATEADPEGTGFGDDRELGPDFFERAARDMLALNTKRYRDFRGCADALIEDFLARGGRALEEVDAATRARDHVARLRAVYVAVGSQAKAHAQIASMTNDMLKAVVFYMALLLPFCFFVQKLLFKTVRIERQLGLFAVLFAGCYTAFRFIHPAFRVAEAPEAIFIAFVMCGLGMFVISILHGRFEGEMRLLFNTMTGHENGGAGYSMVGQQAMLVGVNNMKRRRIRTALTTATIVLVTFTMLAFTSVSRRMSPTMIAADRPAPYTGLMVHWPGGQTMDEDSCRVIQQLFHGDAQRITRRWMLNSTQQQGASWSVSADGGRKAVLEAVLGLEPAENGFVGPLPLVAGRFFRSNDAGEAVITAGMADVLGITADALDRAVIRVGSEELRVVGILDDDRLRAFKDVNGFSIVPIGRQITQADVSSTTEVSPGEATDAGVFYVNTSALLILPEETARRRGAAPYSVSVKFADAAPVWPAVERLLTATSVKLFLGSREAFTTGETGGRLNSPGVYYVGSGYRTSIGGLSMLLIPLLIASTIILNTMLGSVFERKKEIAVFNAVGLNPTHIGLFFLAESFVYAIIGSVGGYMIGQGLGIVLNRFNLIPGINLNFSSLTVAYVIVFTIAVVLLSTLYPAIVATKAAVPSGKRKWSLPPNDGHQMNVTFPFIYRPDQAPGVMSYLDGYFAQFTEASIGDMIADRTLCERAADGGGRPVYRLAFHVALAPYDLGVTQAVVFEAAYDERVGAYRVMLRITRVSGQDSNWVTTNKPFMERLRTLLLQWRSMKPAQFAIYVENGMALYAGKESHGQET